LFYYNYQQVVRNRIKSKATKVKIEKKEASESPSNGVSGDLESDVHQGSKLSATELKEISDRKNILESRERRTALTLFLVSGVFLICWGPWFITETTGHWYGLNPDPGIRTLFYWMTVCNSTINPIIYTIFIPNFSQSLKQLFSSCFPCKAIFQIINEG
jgi:5-hydroxytryptamine receptor 1